MSNRKRRKPYGRHRPLRVMTEDELRSGLADLENLPIGSRVLVVGSWTPAQPHPCGAREDCGGVE